MHQYYSNCKEQVENNIAILQQLLRQFKHHLVVMGAAGVLWCSTPEESSRFDSFSNMVSEKMSLLQINWVTGSDLALRLTYPKKGKAMQKMTHGIQGERRETLNA